MRVLGQCVNRILITGRVAQNLILQKISESFGVYLRHRYDQKHHSVYRHIIGKQEDKNFRYLHKVDYKGRGMVWVIRMQTVEEKNVSI